jgi:hypothetical protein
MNNIIILIAISLICAISMYVGINKESSIQIHEENHKSIPIPDIGSIQLLNGCGSAGAANKVADFLRSNNFDVKFVGNADTWNYPYTIVISRTKNDSIANQIASTLKTDKVLKIRNNDISFDVTVVIGPDYGEKIK